MSDDCQLAQTTSIRAFRVDANVLIVAEGMQPSPGYAAKIEQRPEKIFPPNYEVLVCALPGIWPQIVVPFHVSVTVAFPEDAASVHVFHAGGDDDVKIEPCDAQGAVGAGAAATAG